LPVDIAKVLGIPYEALNIWVFIIIQPLIIVFLFILGALVATKSEEPQMMRNLTATLCLTLVVLLGSEGVQANSLVSYSGVSGTRTIDW
jgi:asparagine N-glycosylation enzyme membrane subunit Stt3